MDPSKLRAVASSFPRLVQTGDDGLRAFLRDRLGEDFEVSVEQGQEVRDILKALCEAIAEGGESWARVARAHAVLCPEPVVNIERADTPLPKPTFLEAQPTEPRVSPWVQSPAAAAAVLQPSVLQPRTAQPTAPQPSAAQAGPDETIALGGLGLQPALPFKEGSPVLPPAAPPAREAPAASRETETTLAHTAKPAGPPLPFVEAGGQPVRDEERTVRVSAPVAAGPASPAGDATLALPSFNLTIEQLAALQVELQAYPGQRAAVLAKYGLPSEAAYKMVDQRWALRCLTEPATMQRFQQVLAHYRSLLPRRSS